MSHGPGGFKSIPQMPEHMGISYGTMKLVSDACDAWLAKHGIKKSLREMADEDYLRKQGGGDPWLIPDDL